MNGTTTMLLLAMSVSVMGAEAPAPQPARTKLTPTKWKDAPAWIKAPDGIVEFMPDPRVLTSVFKIGKRRFHYTSFGWLERLKGGNLRIVPKLYGRSLSPLTVRKGRLLAIEAGALVKIKPADWSVVSRIKLPLGFLLATIIEDDCYWLLEGSSHGGGRPGVFGHKALVRYSLDGKETFRYVPRPAPGFDRPIASFGLRLGPNPLIVWTAFDTDAIWLLVADPRGEAPNDAPISGPSQIVRIDRAKGGTKSMVARPWLRTVVNAHGRLLWAQSTAHQNKWTIEQLDKKTMAVSTATTLEINYINEMKTAGENLWIRKPPDGLLALSLKDLKPVDPKDAGEPPAGLRPYNENAMGSLLGSDSAGVWLAVDRFRIGRINDDGTMSVWGFDRVLRPKWPAYYAATSDKSLFVFWRGRLWRLTDGSDNVVSLSLGDRNLNYLQMLQVGGRVWLRAKYGGDLMTTDLNLGDPRSIPSAVGDDTRFLQRIVGVPVPIGDDLFARMAGVGGSPIMVRIAPGGKVTSIKSFDRFIRGWFKRQYKREATVRELARYVHGPAAWVDGRLLLPLKLVKNRLAIWSYDPKADRWSDATIESEAHLLSGNPLLAIDKQWVLLLGAARLTPAARRPNWFPPAGYQGQVLLTNRFVYARNSWGIMRIKRKTEKR